MPLPVGHSDTHWIPQWGAGPRSRLHHEVPAPRPRAAAHRAQNVVSRKRRQRERERGRRAGYRVPPLATVGRNFAERKRHICQSKLATPRDIGEVA